MTKNISTKLTKRKQKGGGSTISPIVVGDSSQSGTTISTSNVIYTTGGSTSSGTGFIGYNVWTDIEVAVGKGKLIEEGGELIWVRPNGTKFNLTGKEASFNQLYDRLK